MSDKNQGKILYRNRRSRKMAQYNTNRQRINNFFKQKKDSKS